MSTLLWAQVKRARDGRKILRESWQEQAATHQKGRRSGLSILGLV